MTAAQRVGAVLVACISLSIGSSPALAQWAPYHGSFLAAGPGLGNYLEITPSLYCSTTPRTPLHVTMKITWGGGVDQGKARFADACDPTIGGERIVRGELWFIAPDNTVGAKLAVFLDDLNAKMQRVAGDVRLDLEAGGHHQTLRYHFVQQPGGRVWQGTDAFVNYCIDGAHVVHSSGGNLYCDRPSSTIFSPA